jgi:APA family basic amino acid/polyamine antiporter
VDTARASAIIVVAHATLYGLGVTIGAGIYVPYWCGCRSLRYACSAGVYGRASTHGFVGCIFCRAGRTPSRRRRRSGYAREAFHSDKLATAIGLPVVAIAIVSAATNSVSSAGYLAVFIALPSHILIAIVVLAMGAIAAWGVKESVSFAGVMTVVEIGGLLLLICAGLAAESSSRVCRKASRLTPRGQVKTIYFGPCRAAAFLVL